MFPGFDMVKRWEKFSLEFGKCCFVLDSEWFSDRRKDQRGYQGNIYFSICSKVGAGNEVM